MEAGPHGVWKEGRKSRRGQKEMEAWEVWEAPLKHSSAGRRLAHSHGEGRRRSGGEEGPVEVPVPAVVPGQGLARPP